MKLIDICINIFLIYIICFLSVNAIAEEDRWNLYYSTPDGNEHYYDSKSVMRTSKDNIQIPKERFKTRKSYIKVWIVTVEEKIVFNKPDYKLKESRISREFDCSKRKVRMLMKSDFYENGFQNIEGRTRPWESIDLKPSYEVLYEIVCPKNVKVVSPNGGETLTSGDIYSITWTTDITVKSLVAKVTLYYTNNGGVTWEVIDTIKGSNPGSYSGTVPKVGESKEKCKVKVELKDASGNILGTDISDRYFTIQQRVAGGSR